MRYYIDRDREDWDYCVYLVGGEVVEGCTIDLPLCFGMSRREAEFVRDALESFPKELSDYYGTR